MRANGPVTFTSLMVTSVAVLKSSVSGALRSPTETVPKFTGEGVRVGAACASAGPASRKAAPAPTRRARMLETATASTLRRAPGNG